MSRAESFLRGSLVALLLGLGFGLHYYYLDYSVGGDLAKLIFPDESTYYFSGAQLLQEQGLKFFITERSLWTGPLNLFWITLFELNIPAVKIANLILTTGLGILVYTAALKLFNPRVAVFSIIVLTLHPPFYVFGGTILTEPVFIFLLTLAFMIWILWGWSSVTGAFLTGLVFGLATLTRPTLQLFPFWFLLVGLISFRERTLWKLALALLLGFLIPLVPLLAKNFFAFDKAGIANGLGAVLFLGNDLRKFGDEPVYSGQDFDTYEITSPYTHLDIQGDKRLTEAALATILNFPGDAAWLTIRKIGRYLFGYPNYYFFPRDDWFSFVHVAGRWRIFLTALEIITTVSVVFFGILGLWRLKVRPTQAALVRALLLYFVVLHAFTFAIPRLALPIFPLLVPFAVAYAEKILTKNGLSRSESILARVGVVLVMILILLVGRLSKPGEVSAQHQKFFPEVLTIEPSTYRVVNQVRAKEGEFTVKGEDPFVVYRVPVAAKKNQSLMLSMNGLSSGKPGDFVGQVFWRGAADSDFSEQRSLSFPVSVDGVEHNYMVVLSKSPLWTGEVEELRIDFPALGEGTVYHISRLAVAK